MNNMIQMFPDATKENRKKAPVYYGADNKEFGKRFWRNIWGIFLGCLWFVVAAVVILILMGALKLLGVKSLE
jgi:hypothetical protein